jgi:hypothetical protein
MNETFVKTRHEQTKGPIASAPIHTTLYDLIEAVDAAAGSSDNYDVVTDVVMRVLKTYRVSCLGDFEGCGMVLDDDKTSYSAVA